MFYPQAQRGFEESSHKLDILKLSLEKRLRELAPASPQIQLIKEELATGKSEVSKLFVYVMIILHTQAEYVM